MFGFRMEKFAGRCYRGNITARSPLNFQSADDTKRLDSWIDASFEKLVGGIRRENATADRSSLIAFHTETRLTG